MPVLSSVMPMAVASGSSSLSSVNVSQGKYDVFLNFRGEDTRCTFTCHFYNALRRKNINVFIDDEAIQRGDELSPTLLATIEEAKLSIVILSKNYVSSKWCLNELVKIMECRKTKQQIVIPVFYHIDPSHVRTQSGTYENAFAKHEKNIPFSKVEKWRTVLHEVANIGGWNSTNTRLESDLVENITEEVLRKLNGVSNLEAPSNLVGIDKHVKHIELLLRSGLENVCIVGIWGMGGIGKTSIAEILFKKHSAQFEGCYFLENVREKWEKQGKKKLRNKLLSEILGDKKVQINTPSISSTFVVDRLKCRKVLVVLDDVNSTQQIEDLVGEKAWYGPGSRFIITTRNKDVINQNDRFIYKVTEMDDKEALCLFSLKAFHQDQPYCEFKDLSRMAINYAQGNPLALKVLGSFLHSKQQEEWESTLKKLKRVPNVEIHNVLSLSYEGLDYEEKQIFLDIACCLKGETKWLVINLLESYGFSINIGLRSLENKSLITISRNHVQMHDLIQEIGWQVVCQESPRELGKRSRLWDPEDIYHVFKRKRGMDYSVESILLNMAEIKDVEIGPDAFSRMPKLRILKFYLRHHDKRCNVHVPKGLEFLPNELCYLHWDLFPSKCLPSSFCSEMLVQLNLQGSLIEKLWEGEQDLTNLKVLSLSHCKLLTELPDLSKAKNLEEIHLDNCVSLQHIPSSMLSLDSLMALNLSNCIELRSIRSDKDSRSLRWLNLNGCSRLTQVLVNSKKLEFLSIKGTAVEELPIAIEQAKNLHCIYFESKRIENLPKNFYQVGLETLDIQIYFNDCPKLLKLPPIFDTSLSITILHLNGCSNLSKLPEDLGYLSTLHELSVKGTSIEALPLSIKLLSHLKHLNVSHCKKLQFLPELPLSVERMYASGCISLETMSSSVANVLIQKLFGSPNWRLLLRQFRESKGSLQWGIFTKYFVFLNCTRLEENVCETIVAEALAIVKYVAYTLPMLKAYAKSNACDHESNKDFEGELLAGACCQMPIRHGYHLPFWSKVRENYSSDWYWCSSCMGLYTVFDLLKEQYWRNTHYWHGSQRICKKHVAKLSQLPSRDYWNFDNSLCLPGSRVSSCFRYQTTTETSVTLELSPCSDLLGFAFYLILSPEFQFEPPPSRPKTQFTCNYLDLKGCAYFLLHPFERVISDHVFLYNNFEVHDNLLKALKERGADNQGDNHKLKFSFEFYSDHGRKDGIKECGVLPLYASDMENELSTYLGEKEIEDEIETHEHTIKPN